MDKKEIATTKESEISFSLGDVRKQISLIQEVMKSVMKKDEHYGTIPGTSKPTLYKAGAEKLNLTFRMAPRYHIEKEAHPNGHLTFSVRCELFHINTNNFLGEGTGLCSTLESKYRYRKGDPVSTEKPVPKSYWETKDIKLIGGPGHVAKKIDGRWMICKQSEDKTENKDIADTYNTVLKIAKKRSHVDAVLTATAASDIFTQDLEDFRGEIISTDANKKQTTKKAPSEPHGTVVIEGPPVVTIESIEKKVSKEGTEFIWFTDTEGARYFTFSKTVIDLIEIANVNRKMVSLIELEQTDHGAKVDKVELIEEGKTNDNKQA